MGALLPECFEVQFGWVDRFHNKAGEVDIYSIPGRYTSLESYRLRLVTSGQLDIGIDQTHWTIDQGAAMLIPPVVSPQTRIIRALRTSESFVLGFRILLFGSIDVTRQLSYTGAWRPEPEVSDALAAMLRLLFREKVTTTVSSCLVRDGAARAIVGVSWKAIGADQLLGSTRPTVPPWLAAVMQDVRHKPSITATELARLTGYSHSQLDRLFQQVLGISPRVYLQRYRIELAQQLLSTTEMPIAAVAEHLGFVNASDFSRFFRRMNRMTPSEYRHAAQNASNCII